MKNTLIDAGPIIALFDSSDRYHRPAIKTLRHDSYQLVSTWPVITEASHMLDFDRRAQDRLLEWIDRDFYVYRRSDGKTIENVFRHS